MQNPLTEAEQLKLALEASGTGTWIIDITSGKMQLDALAAQLFGVNSTTLAYNEVFANAHPKDLEQVNAVIERSVSIHDELRIRYRTLPEEKQRARCIYVKGTFRGDALFAGTVQDVTAETEDTQSQSESEYRYRSIIEEAPLATALYVGRDLIIEIANDVMLSYWGKDRSVIGTRLEDAVPELEGQPFAQILKNIFDTGEIYQVTEAPVVLATNGVLGTYYFDFTYKPLYDEDGNIYAIMNMAVEVTDRVQSQLKMLESEDRYRSIVEEAPIATCLFVGRDLRVEVVNDIMLDFWGKDRSIIGLPLVEAVPELKGQPFLKILDDVFTTGETYTIAEAPVELRRNGELSTYYFDFTYKPLRDSNGEVYAIMDMALDVTERVMSRRKIQESEYRFRAITEQSPMAIGLLKGKDMIIELGNDKIFQVWGKDDSVKGMKLIDALPELKGQPFLNILDHVYATGETYYGYDVLAKLEHGGELRDVYFDFIYSALKDPDGSIKGVLILANDVTQRIEALRRIAQSEEKLRVLMNAAPAAMILFVGKDNLIIDSPNEAMLEYIGHDESITGMPLLELMPEMANSESVRLIRQTFETGKAHHSYGRQVTLLNRGQVTKNFYNITYTPLFDSEGNVYAVLDTAIDVTESINARKAIEEAEASLRSAIELAELGTWYIEPSSGRVLFSQRMLDWHGLENTDNPEEVMDTVHVTDREKVATAVQAAIAPGSEGNYDEEYTIINKLTGRERIIHAQGKAFFNEKGEAYLFMGTALDITVHKQAQLALENQVKERTNELEAANKGLEDVNRMLLASNEELAQYAYVASHDLQEPLRKITMYSNLLKDRDKEEKFTGLIDKIINSSRRMSLLIKDLLEFSRLLNTDAQYAEVDLNTIVHAVRDDFELLIQEKNAVIEIDNLPVVSAVPLQMNQLFYNLISNGLKFVPLEKSPRITVECEKASKQDLAEHIHHPNAFVQYYKIKVSDNGIGIEQQYVKQIFEVFKRLHGRDEYSGSGIGLAICRRIVANHNGTIYTESEPGKGTTFHIILPAQQYNVI